MTDKLAVSELILTTCCREVSSASVLGQSEKLALLLFYASGLFAECLEVSFLPPFS